MKKELSLLLVCFYSLSINAQKTPAVSEFVPDKVSIIENIEYTNYGDRKLLMDLYRPVNYSNNLPTIIMIRGGGFRVGDKKGFSSLSAALANEGFATICIEYRTLNEALFPAAILDTKNAVKWIKENAEKYNLNPNAIGTMGGSAGAHLAMILATSGESSKLNPTNHPDMYKVQAAVVLEADADFLEAKDDQNLIDWLGATYHGSPDLWKLASPITHIDSTSAPILFIHGSEDKIVPIEQSLNSINRLIEAKVHTELIVLPDVGHSFWANHKWFNFTVNRARVFFNDQFAKSNN